jgi:succinylarginine dihydrolase
VARLRLPGELTLVVELRRAGMAGPRDEAELEHVLSLAEALMDAVVSPDQDWRQIAALARELAQIADGR